MENSWGKVAPFAVVGNLSEQKCLPQKRQWTNDTHSLHSVTTRKGHGRQILWESRRHRVERLSHTNTDLSRPFSCSYHCPLLMHNMWNYQKNTIFYTPSAELDVDYVCIFLSIIPKTPCHRLQLQISGHFKPDWVQNGEISSANYSKRKRKSMRIKICHVGLPHMPSNICKQPQSYSKGIL